MNDSKIVSVETLNETVDYLQTGFLKPLQDAGDLIQDVYIALGQRALINTDINRILEEQNNKFNALKESLDSICIKAKNAIQTSGDIISSEQQRINDTLGNM